MENQDREIEYSPLSGRLTRDGVSVDVKIYRFAGSNDPWHLEVVDHRGGSTVWVDSFPTAQEAYRAFNEVVEEDGMASFAASWGSTIH